MTNDIKDDKKFIDFKIDVETNSYKVSEFLCSKCKTKKLYYRPFYQRNEEHKNNPNYDLPVWKMLCKYGCMRTFEITKEEYNFLKLNKETKKITEI